MVFTSLIACIRSSLRNVEVMLKGAPPHDRKEFERLRFKLRNLETFLLLARMLGSDANLKVFLVRVDINVRSQVNLFYRRSCNNSTGWIVYDLERAIDSLRRYIDGWYITMLNQQVSNCTADHLISESINSFLENLLHFRSLIGTTEGFQILVGTMEACKQQMLFMKSLIRFASMRNVVEPLLVHAQVFILSSAYFLFQFDYSTFYSEKFQSKTSMLLKKIDHVDPRFYVDCTRALHNSKLKSRLLDDGDDGGMKDFLDSLISNLWDLLRLNTSAVSGKDLREVYEVLRSLRTILKKQQPKIKIKENIGDVLCDAGVLVCSLHQTHSEVDLALNNLLLSVRSIRVQIEGAKEPQLPESIKKADVLASNEEETGAREVTDSCMTHMPSRGGATSDKVVVGLLDDQSLIIDQLTRGSRKLQIVAIVGMPGLGKTTLATRIYANPSVMHYFSARAWTPVSQVVDKRKVLLDILNQIDPSKCSETSSLADLAEKLWKSLKRRKYLIFLDDVWETEAWNALMESFPNDNVGSRIILTSRRHDVAPVDLMVGGKPHPLRHFNEEESMELLQMKLSDRLSRDLGMKIAHICRGLPLLIVIVAGVLQTTKPEVWNGVLDGLRNVSSTDMQCRNALELSYQHLPPYLIPCFLYLGVFKEDEDISVRRLLRLWIAEGFVQEDAAEGYLKDLIGRSLVMVAKQRSDGGIKTCRIHDLLRGFCIKKSQDENFFHFLKGYDELSAFNEEHTLQRLCIHSEVRDFEQSKLFCPRARSLIFNSSQSPSTQNLYDEFLWVDISSAIQIFRLLTVLDLEQVDLGHRFPTVTEQIVQLAFLAIRCHCSEIPSMIGNLCNLETFIMQCRGMVSFPDRLWNLQKLQYVYIKSYLSSYNACGGGLLPKVNVESSNILHGLERLSGAVFSLSEMGSVLRKFPNIRKLKCILKRSADDCSNIVVPDLLSRLDSLHILSEMKSHFDELSLPPQLMKLTLGNFSLSSKNLSIIGELPNLRVLKLLSTQLENETWQMNDGEFLNLRILKLVRLRLIRWFTDCDDQLDSFQKLVLDHCSYLEEMPSCLENISTLEVIEVSPCPRRVVNLVTRIEEKREELIGDSSVKIITSNIW